MMLLIHSGALTVTELCIFNFESSQIVPTKSNIICIAHGHESKKVQLIANENFLPVYQ